MDGGAWPFLVGGVICLVNSDNERDSPLLTSRLDLEMRVRSCRDLSLRGCARAFRVCASFACLSGLGGGVCACACVVLRVQGLSCLHSKSAGLLRS